MIIFDRRKGTIFHEDGSVLATGIWAGHEGHANKPEDEQLHGLGPLPAGLYGIGPLRDSGTLGPHVMDLNPDPHNQMFGRSLFRIHGDTVNDASHEASDGCIIAPRNVRDAINTLLDRRIKVV